jgi:flagellar hook-associated protein FlgK
MIANSDSSNILSATGVNSFFTGRGAAGIAVNPALLNDPSQLAASRSGERGDGSNLERFAQVRDSALFASGTRTFTQSMTDLSSGIGSTVRGLDDAQTAQQAIVQDLFSQEQSVAGVDINEEVVRMLDYQRLIQSASKYMATVNDTLDSVMAILR